jgi:MFS family permease
MPQPEVNSEEQYKQSMTGLRNLVETIAPWLFLVGSWVFGGLIAFNLVVISALITVGPVDTAIRISVATFACALPLDVAGVFLLRLIKDMKDVGIDDLALKAFQDAGFPAIETYFPPPVKKGSLQSRRSRVVLGYSLGMVMLSTALTLTGVAAAMWHMAWWIGVLLLAAVALSAVAVIAIVAHSLTPGTEAEKERMRGFAESRAIQPKSDTETGEAP